ncbi:MAG: 2-amino-4-hydroxy-6-hydroxymethyldihydropteridine diphosphokinase [Rhodospirillales bacterium]|jgi:2-amino-4-hydroxy-6-hydroxymethyldihydropteridine diphosphokinase
MILAALGANLSGPAGHPADQIAAALEALDRRGIATLRRSRLWRSPAWPDPSDPPFVNAVAMLATELPPAALLAEFHAVEAMLGRRRGRANAPRCIDIDLLDHRGRILPGRDGGVVLPHPRLAARAFVLLPLRDVAPDWRHPGTGQGLDLLIAALPPHAGTEPLDRQDEK